MKSVSDFHVRKSIYCAIINRQKCIPYSNQNLNHFFGSLGLLSWYGNSLLFTDNKES